MSRYAFFVIIQQMSLDIFSFYFHRLFNSSEFNLKFILQHFCRSSILGREKWRRNSLTASLCHCHRRVPFSPTSFRPCTLIIGLVLMSYNAIAKIYNPVLSFLFLQLMEIQNKKTAKNYLKCVINIYLQT